MSFIVLDSALPADLFTTNREPNDGELVLARSLIHDLETKQRSLTTPGDHSEAGVDDEHKAIEERLALLRKGVSPMRRVPTDVIRLIFLAFAIDPEPCPSLHVQLLFPDKILILSQISSGLRATALSIPCLWATIRVELQHNCPEWKLRHQKYWLEEKINRRSGNSPLHISLAKCRIRTRSEQAIQEGHKEILNIVLSCHSRWREIIFSSECIPLVYVFLKTLTPNDAPLLYKIDFGMAKHRLNKLYVDCSNTPLLGCPGLGKLVNVTFGSIYEHRSRLPFSTITELVCLPGIWRPSLPTDFASTLRLCVSLVSLTLEGSCHYRHSGYIDPVIDLPCLQHLIVSGGGPNLDIFLSISAPRLQSMKLYLDTLGVEISSPTHGLVDFFRRSPNVQVLELHGEIRATTMLDILQLCPHLVALHAPSPIRRDSGSWDGILTRFVAADKAKDILCPNLQRLNIGSEFGDVAATFTTLKMLVTGKLEPSPLLASWKCLKIQFRYSKAENEEARQLMKLMSLHHFPTVRIRGFLWD